MKRILLCMLVASCGTDDWCPLSGSWTGTWSSRTGVSGTIASDLTQDDSNVTGTVSFSGSPCFSAAALSGVFAGKQLSGSATAGGIRVDLSATWVNNDLDGTYQVVSGGACTGDTGTFALMRR